MPLTATRRRTVLTVAPDEPDCYRTIGDAVAAAASGAVISIRPGHYREALTLSRDVTLSASGPPRAVTLEHADEPVVRITGENVTFSGIRIEHASGETAAIEIADGQLCLEECVVDVDSAAAVWAYGSGQLLARETVISNSLGAGIILADGAGGQVESCEFDRIHSSAVVIRSGADPRFTSCVMRDIGGSGILAADGAAGRFIDCTIERAGNPAVAIEGVPQPR